MKDPLLTSLVHNVHGLTLYKNKDFLYSVLRGLKEEIIIPSFKGTVVFSFFPVLVLNECL